MALLALAAVTLPTTFAAPAADPEMATCAGGADDHGYSYTVTSKEDIAGDSFVGNYSVASAGGERQLTQQTSYTVGVSLGLDYKSIAAGIIDTCPQGSWYCTLSITSPMVRAKGIAKQHTSCRLPGSESDYEVLMPKIGSDGNPITSAEVCTCKILKHWADGGHPGLLCPGDCALPNGSTQDDE